MFKNSLRLFSLKHLHHDQYSGHYVEPHARFYKSTDVAGGSPWKTRTSFERFPMNI